MRRVFFHIGAHKTGTTYVQTTAAKLEDTLEAAGLRYLRAGREPTGHHALPRAVTRGEEKATQFVRDVKVELADVQGDILVSSENLELLDERQVERVMEYFPDCEAHALFFYRNWGPLMFASWQEAVKHGDIKSYPAYCLPHIAQPYASQVLNFRLPIERWAQVIGRERVSIVSYDAVYATDNVCAFVLRWAGLTNPPQIPDAKINPSLDPMTVEIVRALNEMANSCGYRKDPRVRTRYFDTAVPSVHERHDAALRRHMSKCISPAPDLDSSPAAQHFFEAFLRDYQSMMIDKPADRIAAINTRGETHMTVEPAYLWAPEARAALMHYWLALMPALRLPLSS